MLSNVRCAEEPRVVEKDALHELSHVHADAQLVFVRFEHSKNFPAAHAKRGMAKTDCLLSILQTETDPSQFPEDGFLGNHPAIIAASGAVSLVRKVAEVQPDAIEWQRCRWNPTPWMCGGRAAGAIPSLRILIARTTHAIAIA